MNTELRHKMCNVLSNAGCIQCKTNYLVKKSEFLINEAYEVYDGYKTNVKNTLLISHKLKPRSLFCFLFQKGNIMNNQCKSTEW